jgi:hypothetical protein
MALFARQFRPRSSDSTPAHDYAATREAAMAAFGKSWPRELAMTTTQVLTFIGLVVALFFGLGGARRFGCWQRDKNQGEADRDRDANS